MATPNIPDWLATHNYVTGDYFVNAGTFYRVTSNYTSGSTFGTTDTTNTTTQINAQTWMTFDEWRQISNQAMNKTFTVESSLNDVRGFAVAMAIALGG